MDHHSLTNIRLIARAIRFAAFLLIFPLSSGAQEPDGRTQFWDALEVGAHLDADGRLHVRELQRMVFDGAWNGGERLFYLGTGQRLDLERLVRIDVQGQEYPLVEGDLAQVDHYRWSGVNMLRWRSRLPSDPPFRQTVLTYRIDYVLSGIIRFENDHYELDHDFAFPNRSGIIKRFLLRLTLDPVWIPNEPVPREIREDALNPGESVLVQRTLRYTGAHRPAGVSHDPVLDFDESSLWPATANVTLQTRNALAATMIAIAVIMLLIFSWRETRSGRFRPLLPLDKIDRAWLDRHVYAHLPEVVGVLWDSELGSTEVAAMLARMTQEGKLASRVEKDDTGASAPSNLHLELKVPRDHLSGHEAELIGALFVDGGTTTSTYKIQAHYRNTGFNPVSKIAIAVKWDVQRIIGIQSGVGASTNIMPFLLLVIAAVILIPVNVQLGVDADSLVTGLTVFSLLFYMGFALLGVMYYRRTYASWFQSMAGMLAVGVVFAIPVLVLLLYDPFKNSLYLFIELITFWILAFGAMLHNARTREGVKAMEQRWLMSSARAWFKAELKKSSPSLDDVRYPYLVALGLGGDVDRWFQTFGAQGVARPDLTEEAIGSSPLSADKPTWSGGGGSFGGAGASTGWVAAANGMAASIPNPATRSDSSGGSSSSSSSDSSSSSGGGGGGAW